MKKRDDKLPIVIKSSRYTGGKAVSASFVHWSVAEAVEVAKVFWCEGAATVVAWSALSAHCEGDTCEYRFWLEVFKRLEADPSQSDLQRMVDGGHQHPFH